MDNFRQEFKAHPDRRAFLDAWRAELLSRLATEGISVSELARWLGYKASSTLRRQLYGETDIPGFELLRLAQVFDLPLDLCRDTIAPQPPLGLRLTGRPHEAFRGEAHVKGILGLAEAMAPGGTYYVSTSDLPFSALCAYPLLAALHIFTLEGGGGRQDVNFDYDTMRTQRKDLLRGFVNIDERHATANNVEVWGLHPLASFLQRLGALRKRGAISEVLAIEAYDNLSALVGDIRSSLRTGHKRGKGRFELYAHGSHGRSTNIVAEAPNVRIVIHTIQHPYYAVSYEPSTVELFSRLFQNLRAEATPINGSAPYLYRKYCDSMLAAVEAGRADVLA